jgi:hypothetical protein
MSDTSSGGLFGRAFDMLRNAALPPDGDEDGDLLTNAQERRLGTDPRRADTDGDGGNDGYEVHAGRDPLVGVPGAGALNDLVVPALAADPDGDGVRTIEERALGTDPMDADTDGDGSEDFEDGFVQPDGHAVDPSRVGEDASPADVMAAAALRTVGVDYRRGAEVRADDDAPTAFDSSELAEYAAAQAGVDLPDGSWHQYRALHGAGAGLTVDEAIKTRGALLFHFDEDPLTSDGRPRGASVMISMGDGTVVHASEAADEVVRVSASRYEFTHAAEIPGIHEPQLPHRDGPQDVEVPAEIDDPTWLPADDGSIDGAPPYDAPVDHGASYDDGTSYDDGAASYDDVGDA